MKLLPNTNSFLLERKRHVTSRHSSSLDEIAMCAVARADFCEQTKESQNNKIFLPSTNSFLLERKPHITSRHSSSPAEIAMPAVARADFCEQTKESPVKGFRQTTESKNNKMFLPSTDSFTLHKPAHIIRPTLPIFSPHSHSFLLKSPNTKLADLSYNPIYTEKSDLRSDQPTDPDEVIVDDHKKRTFLKAAGVAGVGLVASQLLPKDASAFILGSSPTTGIVGVKNDSNTRINPATEETADSILKTTDLDFDGSGYVNVNVAAGGVSSFSDSLDVSKLGLVDADRHMQVDVLSSTLPSSASTESTLQTISFGGTKYSLRMITSGSYDYIGEASIGSATSSAVWRVKRVDNTSGDITMLWANTGTFNQVWDNYSSLSYA